MRRTLLITLLIATAALTAFAQDAPASGRAPLPRSHFHPAQPSRAQSHADARVSRGLLGAAGYPISGSWTSISTATRQLGFGAAHATSWSTTSRTDDAQAFYWRPWIGVSILGGPVQWFTALAGQWASTGWVSERYNALVPGGSGYTTDTWLLADNSPFGAGRWITLSADTTQIWMCNEFQIYDRNTRVWMYDHDTVHVAG